MCLRDQNLVTLAFLWKKLSQPQFYKDLTRKTAFFEGWSWFKFNNLGLALGTNLKFYNNAAKELKLKVRKFWGLIHTFAEVIGEKLVEGPFSPPPPSWIGLKQSKIAEHHLISFHGIISNCSCVLLLPSVLTFSVPLSPYFYRYEVKVLFDIR